MQENGQCRTVWAKVPIAALTTDATSMACMHAGTVAHMHMHMHMHTQGGGGLAPNTCTL